tara:strand:+ start:417 stop:584 length:168 start_codon:yes stop_codon:yes gene_type:complete
MAKNNHNPIENQIMAYCRSKIQKEKEVLDYIEKHKSILTELGYEIKKKELSNISE